jgi:hypothetical protein
MRLGCRFGQAHEFGILHENKRVKWEVCYRCNTKRRYNKGYKGRTNNTAYLKDHIRNFAQRFGATKRVYNRIYKPEKCKIII